MVDAADTLIPERRYHNDQVFKAVVDSMYQIVVDCQLTPSEMRQAVMLACIKYEMNRMPRAFGFPDQYLGDAHG